jgi:hypothetical protein
LHTAGGAQVGFGLAARKKAPIIIHVERLRSTLLERVRMKRAFLTSITSKQLLDIHSPQKQKLQKCSHRDQPSLSFLV